MKILRRLFFSLATTLYSIIPDLYDIFFRISSSEIFDRDVIKTFSRNIYVIVSACMLFALGIRLLSAIVNPDSFNDSKKGAKRTFLNCFIAVALIAVVPLGFDFARNIQNNLIGVESKEDSEEGSKTKTDGNNLIAVLFLGTNVANNDSIGEVLAKTSFTSFCYLDDRYSEDTRIAFEKLNQDYTEGNMEGVGEYINEKIGGEYEIKFHMILSPLFGGYMVYQMILLCLDVATRAIRLAVLEIMAPLVICAFIFSGTEILQKWFKDVISTYIIVFAKIVGLILTIFGASQVSNLLQKTGSSFSDLGLISRGFVKAAYYIALLTIVKQLPAIINNIFGTNIQEQGGIRGRLGNMAGIGAMAQNAWDQIRQHPLHSAARVISAPVSTVGGFLAHRNAVYQRAEERANEIRRRMQAAGGHTPEQIEAAARRARRASIETGMVGAFGAAFRAGRDGFRNGNMRSVGAQAQRYSDRHPEGSTFTGRVRDTITDSFGFGTRRTRQEAEDRYVDYTDQAGHVHRMTVDQLNNLKSQHSAISQQRSTIRDAALDAITADDSELLMNVEGLGQGNFTQLVKNLQDLRSQRLERINDVRDAFGNLVIPGETDQQFQARVAARNQELTTLENRLIQARNTTRDAIIDYAGAHGGSTHGFSNGTYDLADGTTITLSALGGAHADLISGRDQGIIQTSMNTLNSFEEITNRFGPNGITSNANLNDANIHAQNEINLIDTAIMSHQQHIYDRQNTDIGREVEASHNAVQSANNNGGGNNGGH